MADPTPVKDGTEHGPLQPCLTGEVISPQGLTLLATGGSQPKLDIVFIHGLQGNPEHTWTKIDKSTSQSKQGKATGAQIKQDESAKVKSKRYEKLKFWKRSGPRTSATPMADETAAAPSAGRRSIEADDTTFWPTQLLAPDLPVARIFTYGYDSNVSNFFDGPANRNSITDHGRALLSSLSSQRQDCQGRSLLLIVHSLGGIIVKSALRLSALAGEEDSDQKDIYESTFAIIFFGTPHRGSDWVNAGQILRKFASILGFSTSKYNLGALQGDSEILGILRDDFSQNMDRRAFHITSFQESKGFKGVKGLDTKIVEADSSGLDHACERKIPINANHLEMCKFANSGPTRKDYDEKVRSEILRHWKREIERLRAKQEENSSPDFTQNSRRASEELLKSLRSPEIQHRFDDVYCADEYTLEWVFTKSELGFQAWLGSRSGLYWIKGHPGSGKSTLMKWLYCDKRTTTTLSKPEHRTVMAHFFFLYRGTKLQKTLRGLQQAILHQVLENIPELSQVIIPIREQALERDDKSWTDSDIRLAFRAFLEQRKVRLDATFFIDALDEYDGAYDDIAKFLSSISVQAENSLTGIKVCFSSRPEQTFLDRFTGVPGFCIHDHTSSDIDIVIKAKMEDNPRMSRYMRDGTVKEKRLAAEFAEMVSERAQGVFLWIKLVLDELLEEFTNGETLSGLLTELNSLPFKLEEFYSQTLSRLSEAYQNDAKVIFEVLRRSRNPIWLHDLVEICRYSKFENLSDCTPCISPDYDWTQDSAQRWVQSRTRGLVQISPQGDEPWSNDFTSSCVSYYASDFPKTPVFLVQFLHQTVKAFSQAYTAPTDDRFPCHDGNAYLAKYILALLYQHPDNRLYPPLITRDAYLFLEMSKASFRNSGVFHLIQALCQYTQLAESKNPMALFPVLLEFGDRRLKDLFSNDLWTVGMDQRTLCSISAFATYCILPDILNESLDSKGEAIQTSSPPLLHLAVSDHGWWVAEYPVSDVERVMLILFCHGADFEQRFEGKTAYESLCENIVLRGVFYYKLRMLAFFFHNGQSPNQQFEHREYLGPGCYRSTKQSLLHHAAEICHGSLVAGLLECGADVNLLNGAGSTALDCLCDGKRRYGGSQLSEAIDSWLKDDPESPSREELRERLEVASSLIEHGGKFGVSSNDVTEFFHKERKPITQIQVEMLRVRHFNVDRGIVRGVGNQIQA